FSSTAWTMKVFMLVWSALAAPSTRERTPSGRRITNLSAVRELPLRMGSLLVLLELLPAGCFAFAGQDLDGAFDPAGGRLAGGGVCKVVGLVDLEAEEEVGGAVQFEHHAAAEQQVAGVDAELFPGFVTADAPRAVLLPEGDQALMLGANGLALGLAGALRWNGVGAQRAVAVVVGEAPVHVQGGTAAELQAAGVVRVDVAHRGWLGTKGLAELGQLRVER